MEPTNCKEFLIVSGDKEQCVDEYDHKLAGVFFTFSFLALSLTWRDDEH